MQKQELSGRHFTTSAVQAPTGLLPSPVPRVSGDGAAVAASVGEDCTVYVGLVGEGTAVWRPVSARRIAPGLFRLQGPIPDGEKWEFGPDEVVRCAGRVFAGGAIGMVAFQRAEG